MCYVRCDIVYVIKTLEGSELFHDFCGSKLCSPWTLFMLSLVALKRELDNVLDDCKSGDRNSFLCVKCSKSFQAAETV